MKQTGTPKERATTSGFLLFGKFVEVMQVVLYQGAIFYDQYIMGTEKLSDNLTNHLPDANGEVKAWLLIEIIAFYMIIIGAITFLILESCTSIINEEVPKEPARSGQDIIKYSIRTLEWQGFNFLLIFTPCLLILMYSNLPLNTQNETFVSWLPIMITLIAVHSFQYVVIRRIIKVYKRSKEELAFINVNESEKSELVDSFEKRFDSSKWWALAITGAAYLGIGIYCLLYPALQVYYMLWVPTSFFIYLGTVVYYAH